MKYRVLRNRMIWVLAVLASLAGVARAQDFATASSIRRIEHIPFCALDGDKDTRWSSDTAQPVEWLQIDLGREVPIRGLRIRWENAYAVAYALQVSSDGADWREVYRQSDGQGGMETIAGLEARGRYLKFVFTEPNHTHLYSIWEMEFLNAEAAEALREQLDHVEAEARRRMSEQQARLRPALADAGVGQIVFVTRPMYEDIHWYANIAYYAADANHTTYAKGAGLYLLHVPTGAVQPILEDPEGTIRDPAVHYDGKTILFSWRKGGTKSFHLYTIQPDGTGLARLTSGDYDDIEPAWLPDGGIAFVSSRSRRWVNCWYTQVATVHRCDGDGGNIRPLSANLEHDNTPWPLPDGRLLYTRWEYIDRGQVDFHHLWAMNPDGTNQAVYFGNMHPGGLYIDAKPIPGTDEVLTINSPLHGKPEHEGYVAIVSAKTGPDDQAAMRNIAEGTFTDPYPITQDLFMAAQRYSIVFVHRDGRVEYLYELGQEDRGRRIHEPRPLVARPRELAVPPRTDYAKTTGRLVLADAHVGRNMVGVAPGDVKRLLVVEALPKPINYGGGMEPITYGGSFSLERILGTVPVEEDGSAYLELPANRSLFFIAQDGQGDTIKRMQSFLSVMPGETTSCVGCHEPRTQAVANPGARLLQALQRAPSTIEPLPDIPAIFDFPRDIQPILDRHCLRCHDYRAYGADGPRDGGVILSGDRGPIYSHSYVALTAFGQIADGRNKAVGNLPPRSIGAVASPLMDKVAGQHYGVALSPHEIDMLRYWIETGAPYPGTYAALGGGSIGGQYELSGIESDAGWPESIAAAKSINARCTACHTGRNELPATLSDSILLPSDELSRNDPRFFQNRHFVFNLSRPELSLMLLAPLAEAAGGYGRCVDSNGAPVFRGTDDPDYQAILALCEAGKTRLEIIKRFDMPGFRPPEPYLREMKRYKVLPSDLPDDAPVDPYATDRAYWRSFEQDVALQHDAYAKVNGVASGG